jgi:hypothetical protein
MARFRPRSRLSILQQLEDIKKSRVVPRDTYVQLTSAILSGQTLSAEERQRIIKVLDDIKLDRIRIEDP